MPTTSTRKRLREYLDTEHPAEITEAVWRDLLKRFAPVSESYLRDLLRATGLPFLQPYAGVEQHTLEQLEASLRGMLQVYTDAMSGGNRERARYCRRQVIAAKDRAKFLAQSPKSAPERQSLKREMAQWMLVWLENPEVFPAWVESRKRIISLESAAAATSPDEH